jgi:putative endonuclease
MDINKRSIGTNYERVAGKFLESKGYEIIDYNFHARTGEIDIIAREQEYLVFVEVKYRTTIKNGAPLEAVSISKQKAICKSAMLYMKEKGMLDVPVRFDVVGILGDEIELLQNAFDFVV